MNVLAKMTLLTAFMLRPCHWDAQAEAWARMLPHDSPEDYGSIFTENVRAGRSLAFEVVRDDAGAARVAIVVFKIDRSCPLAELVVEGAFCPDNRRTLTDEFLPQIEAKARELGCATVRFHTMRAGLLEKAVNRGFRVSEVICRKDVRHV